MLKRVIYILFGMSLCLSLSYADGVERIDGTIKVIDGDSISLGGREVRLWGVDAPEWRQQCPLTDGETFYPGREAKKWLEKHAHGKKGYCEVKDRDSYGRRVGICYLEGADSSLNESMVDDGYAFAYRRYSGRRYMEHEDRAKHRGHGLWRFGEGMWSKDHDAPCAYPEIYRHYQSE